MRKSKTITIKDGEQNLTFRITQMPATQLERFIIKTLLIVSGGSNEAVNISDVQKGDFKKLNFLTLFRNLSTVNYDERIEPLLEELLECCTRIASDGVEQICTKETVDGFIGDVRTLIKLKEEAIKLNFSFFLDGMNSQSSQPTPENTKHIKISRH